MIGTRRKDFEILKTLNMGLEHRINKKKQNLIDFKKFAIRAYF
jgi:hypothetical protein